MATRQDRLDEFQSDDDRPADQLLEVLCEDNRGTNLLPFLCRWHNDQWWNGETGAPINAKVIGWRMRGIEVER